MSLRGLTDRGSYSRTPANISEFASSACGSCEVAGAEGDFGGDEEINFEQGF